MFLILWNVPHVVVLIFLELSPRITTAKMGTVHSWLIKVSMQVKMFGKKK